jgi:aldose 1-epimerase
MPLFKVCVAVSLLCIAGSSFGNLTLVTLVKSDFGKTSDGKEVSLFTLKNGKGITVKLISHGARIIELEAPDSHGKIDDITLGLKDVAAYENHTAHFGGAVGRYANRIAGGKFQIDGKEYLLAKNNPPNHLHGGVKGFDSRVWEAKEIRKEHSVAVEFTLQSLDGEEGYPGKLDAKVTYTLDGNALQIDYEAKTDKPTVVNLTNHAYWNLSGATNRDILKTQLMIDADKYLPIDKTSIPTGQLLPVKGTPMDFTEFHAMGDRIGELKKDPEGTKGYDHCYVLRNQSGKLKRAARAKDATSGRVLEVYTTEPGIQFYTANFLDGSAENGGYQQHSAFCLETQHYPDSPNEPKFPSTLLKPGQIYRTTTVYKFLTEG